MKHRQYVKNIKKKKKDYKRDLNIFNRCYNISHFPGSRFLHRTLHLSMKIPRHLGCKKKARCIFRAAVYFRDSFRENKGSRAPRQKRIQYTPVGIFSQFHGIRSNLPTYISCFASFISLNRARGRTCTP